MPKILEKVERRLGEKLGLKAERCSGPKCALIRRGFPPGVHGKARRRGASEFAGLLREKQKVRFLYGLDDKDVKRYTEEAARRPGVFSSYFLEFLERRLDNAVFRLGFAESRRSARHLVSYGHITVNGKTVTIPSYRVRKGEIIAFKERSLRKGFLGELEQRLKKYQAPAWLALDSSRKEGTVVSNPLPEGVELTADVTKIKEFYSR
ncbi:MAG: 30S ribosomal protein S4 [Candidatus Sungbacteria bacterium]|nr:30S ribosomal protein S4 [Candidatus Sungbacteria bacterium]